MASRILAPCQVNFNEEDRGGQSGKFRCQALLQRRLARKRDTVIDKVVTGSEGADDCKGAAPRVEHIAALRGGEQHLVFDGDANRGG